MKIEIKLADLYSVVGVHVFLWIHILIVIYFGLIIQTGGQPRNAPKREGLCRASIQGVCFGGG
jgi:hypothetical protein